MFSANGTEEAIVKRNTILKILNPILGVLLVNQILTGLFSDSLSLKAFGILHQGGGMVFTIAAILHVILNWNWVKANILKRAPAIANQVATPDKG